MIILSVITLLVLLGGGLLVAGINGKGPLARLNGQSANTTQTPAASPTPTATPTPSVPAGYQLYTNSSQTFSIAYPSNWQTSNISANLGSGAQFQGVSQIFLVTDIGPGAGNTAYLDQVFCEGDSSGSGFGGKPTKPKQVSIGGQQWTEEECTNSSKGAHAAVETIIYNGHVYLIAYSSPTTTFSSNRSQYFTPMEQSFKFLT